ncbi:MAG: hypothetical protein RBS43_11480 [Candidatus Cloacimonas sp.]|nr:hypothetical protein [Candidatus Cloacimonas sp.]
MKRLFLTLVLMMLALMLAAQTGLFSLYFGESYTEAKTALGNDEFAYNETSNEDGVSTFVSQTNDYVDKMVLCFVDNELVAWQVFFIEQADEDIEQLVKDTAEDWHGTEEYWDDGFECWVWDLDAKKSLYVGYNFDYYLVAEYFNSDYPQFSELVFW